jgi:hypothetical protein
MIAALVAIGIVLGRLSTEFFPIHVDRFMTNPGESEAEVVGFNGIVKKWNDYIEARDGYIPVDPYTALLDSGIATSLRALVEGGIRFTRELPPRINPKLELNPKRMIFACDKPGRDEVWVYFADGTWAQVAQSQYAHIDGSWWTVMQGAGYPRYWPTPEDKQKWIIQNRNRLIWDSAKGIYAVGPVPTSSTTISAQ